MVKAGVFLFLVIGFIFLTAIASSTENDALNIGAGITDSFRTYSETICEDSFDNESCYENTVFECNGLQYKMPLRLTGYTIHDKVYIREECDNTNPDKGDEKDSPFDWVKDEEIRIQNNRVILNIKNAKKRWFIDSNSMDPLIDDGTNTIEVKPNSPDEIKVGDIISYDVKGYDYAFVHRVVKIEKDNKKTYFITKGDNLKFNDEGKVRFEQIEGVVVGIIY